MPRLTGGGRWSRSSIRSTVTKIKEAIDRLAPQEYCELMSVLHPFEDDDWDRQMTADVAAGKFVAMNEKAERIARAEA